MEFLNAATLASAGAVAFAVEFLKLKIIPVQLANKYPVPTNIVLSILAALFVVDVRGAEFKEIVMTVLTIAVVAAIVYNNLLGRWNQLKDMEG